MIWMDKESVEIVVESLTDFQVMILRENYATNVLVRQHSRNQCLVDCKCQR